MFRKIRWRKGNGTNVLGISLVLLILFFFFAIFNLYQLKTTAYNLQLAADSMSDAIAIFGYKEKGTYEEALAELSKVKDMITGNTSLLSSSFNGTVTLDEEMYEDEDIAFVTVKMNDNPAISLFGDSYTITRDSKTYFPTSSIGKELFNNVPYYCQGDYPNVSFDTGTVADSGCGITSFSMVASYFTGKTITPVETAPWAMANGADTVTNWNAFYILAEHYGIKVTGQATGPLWGGSEAQAIEALRNGCLVIGSHTNGYFNPSGRGHYIVYTGVTSDGKVYVNDPASRENSSAGPYDTNTAFSHCKQYWIFSK